MSTRASLLGRLVPAGVLFAATLFVASGCGKSGGTKDTVSGKVTLSGQPVAGQVVFVGSDSKEYASPIGPDGSYQVIGCPKGEATVLVKGMGGAPAAGGKVPGGSKGGDLPGAGAGGTAPPAKYATAAGGLKVSVTGGDQKHDIPLNP